MNYEEVSNQLVRGACEVEGSRIIVRDEIQTTALYFVPAFWFVGFAAAGMLFVGVYDGPDLRLVGTRQYRFHDLTPESLEEIIVGGKEKWLKWKLGFD